MGIRGRRFQCMELAKESLSDIAKNGKPGIEVIVDGFAECVEVVMCIFQALCRMHGGPNGDDDLAEPLGLFGIKVDRLQTHGV